MYQKIVDIHTAIKNFDEMSKQLRCSLQKRSNQSFQEAPGDQTQALQQR